MARVCNSFDRLGGPIFRWILAIWASPQRRSRYPPRQRLPLPLRGFWRDFEYLVTVALLSGTIAGLLLFAVQHFTTFPLIEKAEVYESAAEKQMPGMHHDDEGWQPAEGFERTSLTALSTVLVAIGFAALLFGTAAIAPVSLDGPRGALWGLAAYICIDLAPSWGLPPQPPGVPVADLYARQLWWVATAIATAIALWLLLGPPQGFAGTLDGSLSAGGSLRNRRAGCARREFRTAGIDPSVCALVDSDNGNILACSWFDRWLALPPLRMRRGAIGRPSCTRKTSCNDIFVHAYL